MSWGRSSIVGELGESVQDKRRFLHRDSSEETKPNNRFLSVLALLRNPLVAVKPISSSSSELFGIPFSPTAGGKEEWGHAHVVTVDRGFVLALLRHWPASSPSLLPLPLTTTHGIEGKERERRE
uniref:Uncharacterized protein n=1 Tax=Oryza punctata TaxID=4537 RepID=A0A0E0JI60_ORYPU